MNEDSFFTRLAWIYDWFVWHRSPDHLFDLLKPESGRRLLDVGGGTGEVWEREPRGGHDSCYRMILDRNLAMLRQNPDLPIGRIRADGVKCPLTPDCVDRVLLADSLHHIGAPRAMARELRRISRPDVRIVIEEFNPDTTVGGLMASLERIAGLGSSFWTPDELRDLMEDEGFSTEEVRHSGFVYYACFRL